MIRRRLAAGLRSFARWMDEWLEVLADWLDRLAGGACGHDFGGDLCTLPAGHSGWHRTVEALLALSVGEREDLLRGFHEDRGVVFHD